jgi:hydroxyacylglutathione hydrolase
MPQKITTICLKNGFASVNCYLVETDKGFILIDTGWAKTRAFLEANLDSAGCKPGNLKLIIATHGDFDHIGNCAYLRNKFGTKLAMGNEDRGMAERGDMFWNRKKGNVFLRTLAGLLFTLAPEDRFSPDVCLKDGDDLGKYGLDAKVISIPGHSAGSIGIHTATGDLFCGDLFQNTRSPALSSIMDDPAAAQKSSAKLDGLHTGTVYPGHGRPFHMELLKN